MDELASPHHALAPPLALYPRARSGFRQNRRPRPGIQSYRGVHGLEQRRRPRSGVHVDLDRWIKSWAGPCSPARRGRSGCHPSLAHQNEPAAPSRDRQPPRSASCRAGESRWTGPGFSRIRLHVLRRPARCRRDRRARPSTCASATRARLKSLGLRAYFQSDSTKSLGTEAPRWSHSLMAGVRNVSGTKGLSPGSYLSTARHIWVVVR